MWPLYSLGLQQCLQNILFHSVTGPCVHSEVVVIFVFRAMRLSLFHIFEHCKVVESSDMSCILVRLSWDSFVHRMFAQHRVLPEHTSGFVWVVQIPQVLRCEWL